MQKRNRNATASQQMFGVSLTDPRIVHTGSDPDKATYNDLPVAVAIAAKEFLGKLRGGQGLYRTLDAASGANSTSYEAATGQKINRNAIVGSQDLETMGAGNTVNKAERVAARASCAKFCKRPGRTSCPYCNGESFAAKSQREGDPSHNVNHSRSELAKGRTSSKV